MQRDYSVDSAAVALTAATPKSLIGLSTGAGVPIDLVELMVSADGTATGTLKVELITATADGAGTGYTPKAVNAGGRLVASTTTAKIAYSIEPTTITVLQTFNLVTPTGPMDIMKALGRELTIPISTLFYVRLTASVGFNGFVCATFEE